MGILQSTNKIIETGDPCDITWLLNAYFSQRINLNYKQFSAAVCKLFELDSKCASHLFLDNYFLNGVKLNNDQVIFVVSKIIESHDGHCITRILRYHFKERINLTEEQLTAIFRECIEVANSTPLRFYLPRLTERQIDMLTKKMDPDKRIWFLENCFQNLDLNSFRWIVKTSQPLHIRLFWKKYSTKLPDDRHIIVEEIVVKFECQKMIAILTILSKYLWRCDEVIAYFVKASWQDLRCLL